MDVLEMAIGQDFGVEIRIMASDGHGKPIKVVLTGDAIATATSLTIKPDHPALASGDKLLFGEDVVITLSGACAAGVTTLAVNATTCALRTGDELAKIRDITGYTLQIEALTKRGDATPVIANGSFTTTLATQTGDDRGKVTITIAAAVTAVQTASDLYAAVWRQDAGQKRPLYECTLKVTEAGFM